VLDPPPNFTDPFSRDLPSMIFIFSLPLRTLDVVKGHLNTCRPLFFFFFPAPHCPQSPSTSRGGLRTAPPSLALFFYFLRKFVHPRTVSVFCLLSFFPLDSRPFGRSITVLLLVFAPPPLISPPPPQFPNPLQIQPLLVGFLCLFPFLCYPISGSRSAPRFSALPLPSLTDNCPPC